MIREPSDELQELLAERGPRIRTLASAARRCVLELTPQSWELIYDTYALSIAFSWTEALRDAYCHVAAYSEHVNLGFNRGAELSDPHRVLSGTGKLIRHVRLNCEVDLERPELRALIEDAAAHAFRRMEGRVPPPGRAVVKSRRRR